jgi:AcrR family transcriptional regulator
MRHTRQRQAAPPAGALRLAQKGAPVAQANPRLVDVTLAYRRQLASETIERAAIELFVGQPFESVTAANIASAAGVSVRTFYRYFATKEEILLALPHRRAGQIAEATLGRPAAEAPFQAMRAAIDGLSDVNDVGLRAWQVAVERGKAAQRMAQLVVAVTSPVLAHALAERGGIGEYEMWPEVAGACVATALVSGARRWAIAGGSLRTHLLSAVDVVGVGLRRGPKRA